MYEIKVETDRGVVMEIHKYEPGVWALRRNGEVVALMNKRNAAIRHARLVRAGAEYAPLAAARRAAIQARWDARATRNNRQGKLDL